MPQKHNALLIEQGVRLIPRNLLQLVTCEKVADLERCRILSVRSMDRVLTNRLRILLANRSFIRLRRIRRAHQFAQIGNSVVFLKDHRHNRTRAHERSKLRKERTRRMHVIETLGLLPGETDLLDGDNLESCPLDLGENGSRIALADRVRLDDAEGAL